MNLQNVNVNQAFHYVLGVVKAALLLFVTIGIAVLTSGWAAQKLGITIVRLPSASPQELVYAAGIIWLLK